MLFTFATSQPNIGRITDHQQGCGSRIATLTMVFKLGLEAKSIGASCRAPNFEFIQKVIAGVRFVDGEEQTQQAA